MSTEFDSAVLGAYVDGELSPDEMERVNAHLAGSPEDRRTVEMLRAMNAQLSSAFEAPLRAPLTPALRRRLARRPRWRPRAILRTGVVGSAVAASLVLATAYVLDGYGRAPSESWSLTGELGSESSLYTLLQTGADGSEADMGQGSATLVSTFLDGEDRPCREVELSSGDASRTWAIACRHEQAWRVDVAVSQPGAALETRDAYVPAAGASEGLIVATLEALQAGPVLGPDEVDALIGMDWNPE